MINVSVESKRLVLQLRENEEKYVTGQLDLSATLEKTDELYDQVLQQTKAETTSANKILYDSNLMKLQTKLARQSAKYYKPDSLVFNASEFSTKLRQYFALPPSSQRSRNSDKTDELLWLKMGDFAKKILWTVPSFNFIHGTFDPDPVEVVKKKRKMKEKDKVAATTRPQSMSLNDTTDNEDPMIKEAGRILTILSRLCKKSEDNLVCYFEFVVDPTSFSRTVENIFLVSLLVKEGVARIIQDRNGLPCLTHVEENGRKERNPAAVKQWIVSLSMDEWKDIVKTFKLQTPLIKRASK